MQLRGEHSRDGASDLAICLQSLANDGRVPVSSVESHIDDSDALSLLEGLDSASRAELGLDLPEFSAQAALWAARLFHQLCRFVVCREIGEEQTKKACGLVCPVARGPGTDWSVDLTIRHLPRLFQLARHLSKGDPLVEEMKRIAADWPLSSIGIPGLENLQLDAFISHPALKRLYADRVVAAGDTSRLGDPRLDDLLRADFGVYRDLAPHVSAKLFATS
jgi:hypothetical protein